MGAFLHKHSFGNMHVQYYADYIVNQARSITVCMCSLMLCMTFQLELNCSLNKKTSESANIRLILFSHLCDCYHNNIIVDDYKS